MKPEKEPTDDIEKEKDEFSDEELKKTAEVLTEFRNEVKKHRQQLYENKTNTSDLEQDPAYTVLLKAGDLTAGDEELPHSDLPYSETARKKEERVEDPNFPTIDWNVIESKDFEDRDTARPVRTEAPHIRRPKAKSSHFSSEKAMEMFNKQREDLELLVGEKWTMMLGSLILLLSLAYLVDLGIETGYIQPGMRVFIGAAIASILAFLAYRQRDQRGLSSLLIIAASVSLYYVSYLSYTEYSFTQKIESFVCNILITGVVLAFAVRFRREELIAAFLIGVYVSLWLADIGHESYVLFFVYLTIVNLVMMFIAYKQQWYLINQIIFVCTVLPFIYWLWYADFIGEEFMPGVFTLSMVFVSFFLMNIIYAMHRDVKMQTSDFVIFFINTFLFYIGIYTALNQALLAEAYWGPFSLGFGLFIAVYSWVLYSSSLADQQMFNYAQVIALLLITFSAPLVFSGTALGLWWGAESIFLIWLSGLTKLHWSKNGAVLTMFFTLCLMIHKWYVVYNAEYVHFLFNQASFASLQMIVLLAISSFLLSKDEAEGNYLFLSRDLYLAVKGGLIVLIFWLTGNFELFLHDTGSNDYSRLQIGLFNSLIIAAGWIGAKKAAKRKAALTDYAGAFLVIFFLMFGFFESVRLRDAYLTENAPLFRFLFHYINVSLALIAGFILVRDIYYRDGQQSMRFVFMIRYVTLMYVFYLSTEMVNVLVIYSYDAGDDIAALLDQAYRGGFTVLWFIASFGMMALGIRLKIKEMRIMALVLFGVILLKFFALDFFRFDLLGRILSAMLIGGLLILVSKMYRHLLVMVNEGEISADILRQNQKEKVETEEEDEHED